MSEGVDEDEPGVAVVGTATARSGRVARKVPTGQAGSKGSSGTPDGATSTGRPAAAVVDTIPGAGTQDGMDPDGPVPAGGPARSPQRRLIVALAILTILAVVVAVVGALGWSSTQDRLDQQAAVEQQARTFVVNLTNLSPQTIDAHFADISAVATGAFAQQEKQFFTGSIRQQLETNQAYSQGQIRSLGIDSIKGDQATVYAIVDQVISNRNVTTPEADVLYLQIELTRTGGTWRISTVTNLSGSGPSAGSASPGVTSPPTTSTPTSVPAG